MPIQAAVSRLLKSVDMYEYLILFICNKHWAKLEELKKQNNLQGAVLVDIMFVEVYIAS